MSFLWCSSCRLGWLGGVTASFGSNWEFRGIGGQFPNVPGRKVVRHGHLWGGPGFEFGVIRCLMAGNGRFGTGRVVGG